MILGQQSGELVEFFSLADFNCLTTQMSGHFRRNSRNFSVLFNRKGLDTARYDVLYVGVRERDHSV